MLSLAYQCWLMIWSDLSDSWLMKTKVDLSLLNYRKPICIEEGKKSRAHRHRAVSMVTRDHTSWMLQRWGKHSAEPLSAVWQQQVMNRLESGVVVVGTTSSWMPRWDHMHVCIKKKEAHILYLPFICISILCRYLTGQDSTTMDFSLNISINGIRINEGASIVPYILLLLSDKSNNSTKITNMDSYFLCDHTFCQTGLMLNCWATSTKI